MNLLILVGRELTHFVEPMYPALSDTFSVKVVKNTRFLDEKQFTELVDWADIVWCEWAVENCTDIAAYFSIYPEKKKNKRVVCRLHGFEAREGFTRHINWQWFDEIICVGKIVKTILLGANPELEPKTRIVHNGVFLDRFKPSSNLDKHKIAWVGNFYPVKNPQMMLLILKSLPEEYTLHVAGGGHGDANTSIHMKHMPEQLGIAHRVFYEGKIPYDQMPEWYSDKGSYLVTSIMESCPVGICEAAAVGLQPVMYDFPLSQYVWQRAFRFQTVEEACKIIENPNFHSAQSIVEEKYDNTKQIPLMIKALKGEE